MLVLPWLLTLLQLGRQLIRDQRKRCLEACAIMAWVIQSQTRVHLRGIFAQGTMGEVPQPKRSEHSTTYLPPKHVDRIGVPGPLGPFAIECTSVSANSRLDTSRTWETRETPSATQPGAAFNFAEFHGTARR